MTFRTFTRNGLVLPNVQNAMLSTVINGRMVSLPSACKMEYSCFKLRTSSSRSDALYMQSTHSVSSSFPSRMGTLPSKRNRSSYATGISIERPYVSRYCWSISVTGKGTFFFEMSLLFTVLKALVAGHCLGSTFVKIEGCKKQEDNPT